MSLASLFRSQRLISVLLFHLDRSEREKILEFIEGKEIENVYALSKFSLYEAEADSFSAPSPSSGSFFPETLTLPGCKVCSCSLLDPAAELFVA